MHCPVNCSYIGWAGSEIKIMETEGWRQQKAQEQKAEEGAGGFLDFSEEAAAAARAAAAQVSLCHVGMPGHGEY